MNKEYNVYFFDNEKQIAKITLNTDLGDVAACNMAAAVLYNLSRSNNIPDAYCNVFNVRGKLSERYDEFNCKINTRDIDPMTLFYNF